VVTVEDGDQIPGGHLEGVIDVARLGVLMGRPGHIADPGLLGEVAKRRPPPSSSSQMVSLSAGQSSPMAA
jgi:hypothetical protein